MFQVCITERFKKMTAVCLCMWVYDGFLEEMVPELDGIFQVKKGDEYARQRRWLRS